MTAPLTYRKNHGRGHSYYIDGVKVPGITTVIGKGSAKDGLIKWAAEETAKYAVNYWDELAELPTADRLTRLYNARQESLKESSGRGTDIHAYAHRYMNGEEIQMPEHQDPFGEAFEKFTTDWEPQVLLAEQPVFSRRCGYAGTPDLLATLNDGNVWLLDWKTGKGIYSDFALQLAAARFADFWLDETGTEQPIPAVQECGCVHLRDDGRYELVPVDAGPDAFRVFLNMKQVYTVFVQDWDRWVGAPLERSPT